MVEFNVSIPLLPVLIVIGVCSTIASLTATFYFLRFIVKLYGARHNYMAHALHEVRRRNNDYAPIPEDEFTDRTRLSYRIVRLVFGKHTRGN